MNDNISNTLDKLNLLYDNQTYFDLYGSTIMIFIFLTLFVFFFYTYFQIIQQKQYIINNWANLRCNPKYIPFAGYITHPEGKTAFEYTSENFQYCLQNVLVNTSGESVNHIQYIINNLISVFMPLQSMFINIKVSLNEAQGIMSASLYTILGSYLTLKSLIDSIAELSIKMLIIASIVILGLWTVPFAWPVAASATTAFLVISALLTVIITFMTDVLHIKSSDIPHLRRCFDKNTLIKMHNGSFKKIADIAVGEYLENGIKVTAKFKVDSKNLKMFRLNGVIVSETHIVKYNNNWIPISNHPSAIEILDEYTEPFLYCLNTSNKEICINNTFFTDWDELYDEQLEKVTTFIDEQYETTDLKNIDKRGNIHKYLDKGYEKDAIVYLSDNTKKPISKIKIGDKMSTNGIVYGIVEIETSDIDLNNKNRLQVNLGNTKLYHLLVTNKIFETNGKILRDYNDNVDFINYVKK